MAMQYVWFCEREIASTKPRRGFRLYKEGVLCLLFAIAGLAAKAGGESFPPFEAMKVYDLVIYGSSPAAISAAIQARRMGKSIVIVSPETRIGGLTTGGLGQTDIGNKSAFGGIALEFYRAVADYYRNESHWTRERRGDYLPDGQCADSLGADSMWTFEPHAALQILERWEKKYGLDICREKRLDRKPAR